MNCANCGAKLLPGQRYCANCGAGASPTQPLAAPPTPSAPLPHATFAPPEDFQLDPATGLYFHSSFKTSEATGEQLQEVIYFYPQTGQYQWVDYHYPSGIPVSTPPTPPSTARRPWTPRVRGLIAICVAVALILVSIVGIAVGLDRSPQVLSSRSQSSSSGWQDFKREYDRGSSSSASSYDPYSGYSSSQPSPDPSQEDIDPLDPHWEDLPASTVDYLSDSPYGTSSQRVGEDLYFLSPPVGTVQRELENDDGTTRSVTIPDGSSMDLYLLKEGETEATPLITLGEDHIIVDFAVSGDYLFYTLSHLDENAYLDGSAMDLRYLVLSEPQQGSTFLYSGQFCAMSPHQGYLYLLELGDGQLLQIGLDTVNTTPEPLVVPLHFSPSSYLAILNNSLSFVGNETLITGYNPVDESFEGYLYNVDTHSTDLLFTSSGEHVLRRTFYYEDTLFFTQVPLGDDTSGEILLGYAPSDDLADITILSTKKGVGWSDHGLFLQRIGDRVFYEKDGAIYHAPLDNPEDSTYLCPLTESNYLSDYWENQLFFLDSTLLDVDTGSVTRITYQTAEPLYEAEITLSNYRTSTSEDSSFNYFDYQGEVLFGIDKESIFEAMAWVAAEIELGGQTTITSEQMLPYAAALIHHPTFHSTYVDEKGQVDIDNFRRAYYDIFLEQIDFSKEIADGKIPGFLYEDGDIYLDPTWTPKKGVTSVEELPPQDAETRVLKAVFADGTSVSYTVTYVDNPVILVSQQMIKQIKVGLPVL